MAKKPAGKRKPAPKRPERTPFRAWEDWEDKLLGTLPDADVAKLVKRSKRTVTVRRNQKGIESYVAWGRPPAGDPVTPLGIFVRKKRLELGARVEDLAAKAGIPDKRWRQIEGKKLNLSRLDSEQLRGVARALGAEFEKVLELALKMPVE